VFDHHPGQISILDSPTIHHLHNLMIYQPKRHYI